MRKRYLFLVLAFTFGLALHMVEQYTSTIASNTTPETDIEEAEYYGEQLIHRQYDESGKLQQTLTARESRYYPETGVTHFTAPALTSQDQQEGWQIDAKKGHLSDQSTHLYLEDNVRISSLGDADDFLLLETDQLNFHSGQGNATTDAPVTIRSQQGTTRAQGLSMNIDDQRLILKSDVRTRYEQN